MTMQSFWLMHGKILRVAILKNNSDLRCVMTLERPFIGYSVIVDWIGIHEIHPYYFLRFKKANSFFQQVANLHEMEVKK